MFAVCTSGSRSPQIDCLAAHQNRPSGFSRASRLSCQSKRQTLSVCDLCVITSLALKKCVKGNNWITRNCFTVTLTKTEMWPLSFKVQHLTVLSMTVVKASLYVSRTNSLISWENVTCLWIKHALCSRHQEACQRFSFWWSWWTVNAATLFDVNGQSEPALTDELTNRQNPFQQTRQSQQNDTTRPGRIL